MEQCRSAEGVEDAAVGGFASSPHLGRDELEVIKDALLLRTARAPLGAQLLGLLHVVHHVAKVVEGVSAGRRAPLRVGRWLRRAHLEGRLQFAGEQEVPPEPREERVLLDTTDGLRARV